MFEGLLAETKRDIDAVKAVVETGNRLRNSTELLEKSAEAIKAIVGGFPQEADWKVYDHCAAVIRLCAIYESFVDGIAADWLTALPKIVPEYSKLASKVRDRHREGIANILLRASQPRFRHLTSIGPATPIFRPWP